MNRNKIYIYSDDGCSDVETLELLLKFWFSDIGIDISKIDADGVKKGKLDNKVLAFFMPGGKADNYYIKLLDFGNKKIRDYVANGGIYFGICAGAYYACREVQFEDKTESLYAKGQYGLDLLNCVAKGTLYKELGISKFVKNPSSMAVVDLHDNVRGEKYASLYHGGPFFDEIEENFETIADYVLYGKKDMKKHAIISSKFGKGKVLLSGVHFEIGPKEFGVMLPFMSKNNDYLRCFRDIRNKENKRQKLLSDLMEKVRN